MFTARKHLSPVRALPSPGFQGTKQRFFSPQMRPCRKAVTHITATKKASQEIHNYGNQTYFNIEGQPQSPKSIDPASWEAKVINLKLAKMFATKTEKRQLPEVLKMQPQMNPLFDDEISGDDTTDSLKSSFSNDQNTNTCFSSDSSF